MSKFIPLLLLFFTLSFLIRTDSSFDQDLGRHIRLGEIIVKTKSIPLVNLFSYTHPDFPFINSHWLFEVFVYTGLQTVGLKAVLVLKLIILLASVFFVIKTVPKNQYLLLPVGFIFIHLIRERPELRPEIFSFLFTSLTTYTLNKQKYLLFLPIIQLVWVNTHIYFIVGIFLQIIYLLDFAIQRKIKKIHIYVFIFSVLLSFLNPSGIKGFLNPFTFNANYGYTIVENQTVFFLESINFRNPNFLFLKAAVLLSILSIIFAFFRKNLSVKNLGLTCFGIALALLNVRSFPYLVFISLPAVLDNFPHSKSKILVILSALLLVLESTFYLTGDYYKYTDSHVEAKLEYKESAKGAMDFVINNKLPPPIFNNFDIGSYITYRGYPEYKVFVDGRPGEYPKEFFASTYIPMQYDYIKFKEQEKKYGFKTIIFSHTDQTPWGKTFLSALSKDSGWKLVYLDDFMAVYSKTGTAIDLNNLSPGNFNLSNHVSYLRIAIFLINNSYEKPALAFIQKSLQIFPDSPIANGIMGNVGKAQNNFFW